MADIFLYPFEGKYLSVVQMYCTQLRININQLKLHAQQYIFQRNKDFTLLTARTDIKRKHKLYSSCKNGNAAKVIEIKYFNKTYVFFNRFTECFTETLAITIHSSSRCNKKGN